MKKLVEDATLWSAGAASVLIAVLDMTGVLSEIDWLQSHLPHVTLLMVGLALGVLALQRDSGRRDLRLQLQHTQQNIISSLNGVDFEPFPDSTAYWIYARKRIAAASKSINDLTWGNVQTTQTTARAKQCYERYRKMMTKVAEGKGQYSQLSYREIMSFPKGKRLRRARGMLTSTVPNYQLRFYDFEHEGTPPLLQFFVIDDEEVLMSIYPETEGGLDSTFFRCRSRHLATSLNQYFESAWKNAETLKDSNGARLETLEQLEKRYEASLSGG